MGIWVKRALKSHISMFVVRVEANGFFENIDSQFASRIYPSLKTWKRLHVSTITYADPTATAASENERVLSPNTAPADLKGESCRWAINSLPIGRRRSPAPCMSSSSSAFPRSPSRSSAPSLGSAWWLSGRCEAWRRRRSVCDRTLDHEDSRMATLSFQEARTIVIVTTAPVIHFIWTV